MRLSQYLRTIAILAMMALAAIAVSSSPPLPGQVYGTIRTSSQAAIPDLNLFTIEDTSNQTIYDMRLLSGSRYGYDPLILLSPSVSNTTGLQPNQTLAIFLNGFPISNFTFKQAMTQNIPLSVSTPVCGDGICGAYESCILCKADCTCAMTDVLTLARWDRSVRLPNGISGFYNNSQSIPFLDVRIGTQRIAEVARNLSSSPLNVTTALIQAGQKDNRSYTIINVEGPKILYVNRTKTENTLCVKDGFVNSIDDITTRCNANDETQLICDGRIVNGLNCTAYGNQYKVVGALHSAAIEYDTSASSTATSGGSGRGKSSLLDRYYEYRSTNGTRDIYGNLGGGASVGKYCNERWFCSQWAPGICPDDGVQVRNCTDKYKCGTQKYRPAISRVCKISNGTKNITKPAPATPIIIKPTPKPQIPNVTAQPPTSPLPVTEPYIPTMPPAEPIQEPVQEPVETPPEPQVESPAPTNLLKMWLTIGAGILVFFVALALYLRSEKVSEKEKYVSDAENFIRQSRTFGYSDAQIRQSLIQGEWPNKYVEEAFKKVGK